ncbi:MAG TPA: hypothetical protein VGI03_07595 [Verrucomicrobiae bacterium]|jgi:ketosteroid isomerase-like protein
MKIAIRLVIVIVMAMAGTWLWSVLFPTPQHVIRARLNEFARDASFTSSQSTLAGYLSAQTVGQFFSTNVEVTLNLPGNPEFIVSGRDQIVQSMIQAHAAVSELEVDFPDLNVTLAPDQNTATADLTIRAQIDGERNSLAEEMKFTLQKIGGQWLITHIESVQVLT